MVGAEAEYLSAQLWQLPIMQQALEESEASGHTCAGDHCTAPGCGSGGDARDQQQQGQELEGHEQQGQQLEGQGQQGREEQLNGGG